MWKLILVLTAIILYFIYNIAVLILFKTPFSLSETYYLFSNYNPKLKILFPSIMIGIASLLLPAWLEISAGNVLQFLAFFAAAGLLFVGTAPAFMSSDLENKVHTYSAIGSVIFALLWVIFVSKTWFMIPIWFAVIALIAWLTKTWKSALIYWLENVTFMSTFTSILIYFLI
jgi:hypothetical protein